jgi:hypothetical protein
MLRPFCSINIGGQSFDFVTNAQFVTTWKTFTDTGGLTIPHKFSKNGKKIFVGKDNLFKKGDLITVKAGYFPLLEDLFLGYVTAVKPGIPVSVTIEDPTFLLKQNNLNLSFKDVTLKELLTACLSAAKEKAKGYALEGLNKVTIEAVDARLGAFRLSNVNIVNVLEELKKTYALTSYMRGHVLYVGLAYYLSGRKAKFEFKKDIFDYEELEFLEIDEQPIKVKAVSMLENNSKIEIEVGDPNGEQRSIFKYNLTESELRKAATREIERLRYKGFRGAFSTFLSPVVSHGDEIEIIDPDNEEQNGVYLAEAVEYTIGVNGYFQRINLGARIDVRN